MQFFDVRSPSQIRQLLARLPPALDIETLAANAAAGRVLARDAHSAVDLPEFPRAVVDGFAVRAADTFGASSGQPAFLRIAGEVLMGQAAAAGLGPGEAARIATGGMLPPGSDAVVMIEYTETVDAETIEVFRPAAPGDGMVRRGDDVRAGQVLIPAGRRLRPQDVGLLCAAGVPEVAVYRRPRVAVIPTGDEVVPPEQTPQLGQVRDANTAMLAAAVVEAGGDPLPFPIVRDDPELLRAAVSRALQESDMLLLAGGSSVGARDWAVEVLTSFPGAELLAHGVAIRPGKPLALVAVRDRFLFGLPGNPVSALLVFNQFIRDYMSRLAGETTALPGRRLVRARLDRSCASDAGKEDYVRVRLRMEQGVWTAEPLVGKSTLMLPMVQADGLVVIPENVEGLEAGEIVEVEIF
jgi:molybdopterin molybdotransferase